MIAKPMLAGEAVLDKINYPVYVSPKLDGIRALVQEGNVLTRSLKSIPNHYLNSTLSSWDLEGFDGELIYGSPTSKSCYRDTVQAVMSHEGEPDCTFYVFDLCNSEEEFSFRKEKLKQRLSIVDIPFNIEYIEHSIVLDEKELLLYEEKCLEDGYEGVMLTNPYKKYKHGRSSTKSAELLKMKRFLDSEAIILDVLEEQHNANEAEVNELGRTHRSTKQENLIPKGTMGSLLVQDITTDVVFNVGTGFTQEERNFFWSSRDALVQNRVQIKYKYFPVGVKDKPRHPVYLGLRPEGA